MPLEGAVLKLPEVELSLKMILAARVPLAIAVLELESVTELVDVVSLEDESLAAFSFASRAFTLSWVAIGIQAAEIGLKMRIQRNFSRTDHAPLRERGMQEWCGLRRCLDISKSPVFFSEENPEKLNA